MPVNSYLCYTLLGSMNCKSIVLFVSLVVSSACWSQSVLKYNLGSFSMATSNDSIVSVGGQSMSGKSIGTNVYHGYLPLQYSTLNSPDLDKAEFILFPNPASENFTVDLNNQETFSVKVFNLSGKLLLLIENKTSNSIIEMSDLASGTYLIQVLNDKESFGFKKIVKL